ncbi:MAG: hypothetical protein ACE5D7_11600 [Fidelibacterota bacterium]
MMVFMVVGRMSWGMSDFYWGQGTEIALKVKSEKLITRLLINILSSD